MTVKNRYIILLCEKKNIFSKETVRQLSSYTSSNEIEFSLLQEQVKKYKEKFIILTIFATEK